MNTTRFMLILATCLGPHLGAQSKITPEFDAPEFADLMALNATRVLAKQGLENTATQALADLKWLPSLKDSQGQWLDHKLKIVLRKIGDGENTKKLRLTYWLISPAPESKQFIIRNGLLHTDPHAITYVIQNPNKLFDMVQDRIEKDLVPGLYAFLGGSRNKKGGLHAFLLERKFHVYRSDTEVICILPLRYGQIQLPQQQDHVFELAWTPDVTARYDDATSTVFPVENIVADNVPKALRESVAEAELKKLLAESIYLKLVKEGSTTLLRDPTRDPTIMGSVVYLGKFRQSVPQEDDGMDSCADHAHRQ